MSDVDRTMLTHPAFAGAVLTQLTCAAQVREEVVAFIFWCHVSLMPMVAALHWSVNRLATCSLLWTTFRGVTPSRWQTRWCP